jgi:energy-coupling factor transporter ATP-binding protein EcfA2
MPRSTYGPEVKRRSLHLFQLLLSYAEDSLEADEKALDLLRSQIQVRWKDDRQLVVRTKVRHLEALSQLSAIPLSNAQIKEALRRWLDYVECLEDNRPSASGSETWHFTLKLWYPKREFAQNLQQFQAVWEARRSRKSAPADPPNPALTIFQTALENQRYQQLTTNPLTTNQGLQLEVAPVYVPLPLREVLPEAEEAPVVQFPEFFQTLGDRTAIIGDPGSGKTTLMQKLATELQAQSQPVIWISLAELQGKQLSTYLQQDWLQLATGSANAATHLPTQLTEQFATGQVWLLLDAIDEMGLDATVALTQLARELRGWVGQAKIILSCRSSIWYAGKNPLADFRVWQNLNLPQQSTQQVLRAWFQNEPEFADRLLAEIQKPDRRWLRRTIQNPLRLAMLCRTWSQSQGTFPETRTALYHQFVETFYHWKQEVFPISLSQRIRLNQALGQFAWQAIQQSKYRFSQSFIEQHFPNSHLELLDIALQIGWLQQAGNDASYGFYHSTFQEYFAALAIADWHPVQTLQHPEVFRFWLGREDISAAQKTQILTAMVAFDDRCQGFYHQRMYCLAITGLAEFPHLAIAPQMLDQLLTWRFRSCLENHWKAYPNPIVEAATIAMLETDRSLMITALENFIQTTSYLYQKWNAAYSLGNSIDPGNTNAIATLVDLLTQKQLDHYIKLQLCKSLNAIAPAHPIMLEHLLQLVESDHSIQLQRKAAYLLAKIAPSHHPQAIAMLTQISQTSNDRGQRRYAQENLAQLFPQQFTAPTKPSPKRQKRDQVPTADQLEKMVNSWERNLSLTQNLNIRVRSAKRLLQHNPQHPQALATLLELFTQSQPQIDHRTIADTLKSNLDTNQWLPLIRPLQNLLSPDYNYNTQQLEAFKLLWHIAQILPIAQFQTAYHP